jgi:hypothetical protein
MNVDYQDPSLDSLLAEHALRSLAEFTPPGLDGMLAAALDAGRPRRRWVWPAVAAVLLLAIPLVTVLLVRHGRTDGQPAQPAHSVHPVPNTTPVSVGPVPWTEPVWTGHSIWFQASVPPAQYCKGEASIHAVVTEDSAASVTIVATAYSDLDPAAMTEDQKEFCKAYRSGALVEVGIQSSVDLPEPLDGRPAFDGTAHRAHKVLDARMITSIPALSPIFHDFAYSGTDTNMVSHHWQEDDPRYWITFSAVPIDSSTGSSWLHQGTPSTIGLVNGHQTRLDPVYHLIAWANGAYVYLIQESHYLQFSPEQLLNLARSVR